MRSSAVITVLCAMALSAGAQAQGAMHGGHGGGHMHGAGSGESQKAHEARGSVTRADPGQGKATIKHGPVASLNWPGMTMGFEVRDKALFDKLKPGASVEFTFVEAGNGYVITKVR